MIGPLLTQIPRAMPGRFHRVFRDVLASPPDVLALPMVLLHKDLGDCNIMVRQEDRCLMAVD
ncbi:predicted protein [Chaetomium globosum CBS 148.51]|uniref:Aminoglycoside phosphotransferase domain-containing protein n=1 Tax=Chaetomium globosum (strain ATCC 6205 / CBS 148.51 / DSM 1962 / NBRC 6347 / NRRL 1970) TaxID=306901 RepID=Q2GMB4_CHAGB|nr:uncharacterized protein CHGG_10890 [Chaetomium globosum CBS 148.51]EAQ83072.1 predicted protein [Chaetomium globosum CBS 148.51]